MMVFYIISNIICINDDCTIDISKWMPPSEWHWIAIIFRQAVYSLDTSVISLTIHIFAPQCGFFTVRSFPRSKEYLLVTGNVAHGFKTNEMILELLATCLGSGEVTSDPFVKF